MTWLGGLKVSVQLGFSAIPGALLIYPYKNFPGFAIVARGLYYICTE